MAHMKLKNNKKKKFKLRYFGYVILIYFSFSFSYYFSTRYSNVVSNEEFINLLLSDTDISYLYDREPNKIVSKTMNMLFNIDLAKPSTILNSTILKYGSSNNEDDNNEEIVLEDGNVSIEEAESASSYIEDPNPSSNSEPIVYLYNSHQLENYSSEYLKIYGITPNVQMGSYLLKERLNEGGISTIVEETDITNALKSKGWAYYKSYDVTRELIVKAKEEYPSLKYFIDIHRDSISKSATTINIGDKYYAKILFVLGLEYDTYEQNLILMEQVNNKAQELYPGLSRGILKKEGQNVNGVYNQDIDSNVILIEVGTVDNTIEEVYNTMNALSEVLIQIIGGDNN